MMELNGMNGGSSVVTTIQSLSIDFFFPLITIVLVI